MKTVLITGAARGMGLAFGEALAAKGHKVILTDIAPFAPETEALENITAQKLDVTNSADIAATVKKLDQEFNGIDVLINNAAIFQMAPIQAIEEADYERVMNINFKGTLFMMSEVSKHMIARKRGGKIINMTSQAGLRGEALVTLYCASKAAVISATQSAALALAQYGITVNAVAPGVVDGKHWDYVDAQFGKWQGLAKGEKKAQVAKEVPIGRFAVNEDIIPLIEFLAGDGSNYMTAATLNITGGNWPV